MKISRVAELEAKAGGNADSRAVVEKQARDHTWLGGCTCCLWQTSHNTFTSTSLVTDVVITTAQISG
jgi:hypothetical protein